MDWKDKPTSTSEWYWWRAGPGKTAVPTYVDADGLVTLFSARPDGIHVSNAGGQWCEMKNCPADA